MALLRGPQGEDRKQTGPLGAQVGGDRSTGQWWGWGGSRWFCTAAGLGQGKAHPLTSLAQGPPPPQLHTEGVQAIQIQAINPMVTQ